MAKDTNDKNTTDLVSTLWIAGYTSFGSDNKLRTGRVVCEAFNENEAKTKMLAILNEQRVPNARLGKIKPY